MDFDHLLREYLSGSLSDSELEQFRTLLDDVPEYRTELRQTLEIRSLIQDDAMNLVPPPELADHVRIAVGSSFAADVLTEREQMEKRHRVIPYAIRISASTLAAVCLMVGVALTPTLPSSPVTSAGQTAVTSDLARSTPEADAPQDAPKVKAAAAPAQHGRVRQARHTDSRETARPAFWVLGHEVPYRTVRNGSIPDGSSGIASNDVPSAVTPPTDAARQPYPMILSRDPVEILYRNLAAGAYRPALGDSVLHRRAPAPGFEPETEDMFAMDADAGRLLAFGVTIGSGQITETKNPTALLQKSCYMLFSVSENDRIGVEMGASSFQQSERTPYGLGIKLSSGSYGADDIAGLTYDAFTTAQYSGRVYQYGLGSVDMPSQADARRSDPPIFYGKVAAGMPSQERDINGEQSNIKLQPTQPTQPERQEVILEQQIAYGGIFYDRRFQVNRSWDVCGRLTFGGADNAVVGSVRAYAAFNPTKNVTLTVGIGGSGLRSFTSKSSNFSANYGIYYGIETGF